MNFNIRFVIFKLIICFEIRKEWFRQFDQLPMIQALFNDEFLMEACMNVVDCGKNSSEIFY
jgi:hypothetical protein